MAKSDAFMNKYNDLPYIHIEDDDFGYKDIGRIVTAIELSPIPPATRDAIIKDSIVACTDYVCGCSISNEQEYI